MGAWLFKRGRRDNNEYHKRYFTLFDDGSLEYAAEEDGPPRGTIELRKVKNIPALFKEAENKYVIRIPDKSGDYKLYSPNEMHAKKWHSIIVAAAIDPQWLSSVVDGVELTKIHATSKGFDKRTVKIEGACLKGAISKQVPLSTVSKITTGRGSDVLNKKDNLNKFTSDRLFSLQVKDRTIDFDAGNKANVDKWARNLPLVNAFMISQEARGKPFAFKSELGHDFLQSIVDPVCDNIQQKPAAAV